MHKTSRFESELADVKAAAERDKNEAVQKVRHVAREHIITADFIFILPNEIAKVFNCKVIHATDRMRV